MLGEPLSYSAVPNTDQITQRIPSNANFWRSATCNTITDVNAIKHPLITSEWERTYELLFVLVQMSGRLIYSAERHAVHRYLIVLQRLKQFKLAIRKWKIKVEISSAMEPKTQKARKKGKV